jgi:Tfp pilus assembly protein PilN
MIAPNLASRPFLNTRPVWIVTGAAGLLTAVFLILNIALFVRTNRTLEPQLGHLAQLEAEHRELSHEVELLLTELDRVPWKSLASRVNGTNVVLREWGFSWLDLLEDIEAVIPREVRVIRIGPSVGPDEVQLNLMVVARSRDAMIELLTNMITSPSFSNPIPIHAGLSEESATAGYDLTLRVNYHPGEDAT